MSTYKIANKKKFQVTVKYAAGKWHIQIGGFTWMGKVRGGKDVAMKIGEAMHKAWFRTANSKQGSHIDGTCRNVINNLLNVKTLADWRPDRDWWSNAEGDAPNVEMIYIHQI